LKVCPSANRAKMPNRNPTSPIRVVMNALIAADEFSLDSQ
jgi:hypothetical protein